MIAGIPDRLAPRRPYPITVHSPAGPRAPPPPLAAPPPHRHSRPHPWTFAAPSVAFSWPFPAAVRS